MDKNSIPGKVCSIFRSVKKKRGQSLNFLPAIIRSSQLMTACFASFAFVSVFSISVAFSMDTKKVTWSDFFPSMSGNLGDYSIAMPENYKIYKIEQPVTGGYLWGTGKDIRKITKSADTIEINDADHPVLRVRFSPNVASVNGKLIDGRGGTLSKSSFESKGFKHLSFRSGKFMGIAKVPVVALNGDLDGAHVYMLYMASPTDNLVMLVSMQGGAVEQEKNDVWKNFVNSIEIK